MAAKGQNWLQKKPRAQISQSLVNKIMVKTLNQHFPRRERRSGGRGARPGVGAAPGAVEAGARCRDVCRLDSAEPSSVRGQTVPRSRGRSWRPSGERLGERRRVRDSDVHAQWVCVVITRLLLTPPHPDATCRQRRRDGTGAWGVDGGQAACRAPTACRPPGQLPGPPRALRRAPPRNGDPPHAIRGCPGACEPCRPPPWSSSSLSTQRSGRPGLSPPRSQRENRRFSSCFPSVSQWGRRLVKAHCHGQITALKTLIDSLCFLYKSSCQI